MMKYNEITCLFFSMCTFIFLLYFCSAKCKVYKFLYKIFFLKKLKKTIQKYKK